VQRWCHERQQNQQSRPDTALPPRLTPQHGRVTCSITTLASSRITRIQVLRLKEYQVSTLSAITIYKSDTQHRLIQNSVVRVFTQFTSGRDRIGVIKQEKNQVCFSCGEFRLNVRRLIFRDPNGDVTLFQHLTAVPERLLHVCPVAFSSPAVIMNWKTLRIFANLNELSIRLWSPRPFCVVNHARAARSPTCCQVHHHAALNDCVQR
jgi:hypothetical protein